jgi:anti-sigma-K factor RskA
MRIPNKLKDDPALASRYLADQLTTEEREQFEAQLLRDPQVAEELEASSRIQASCQSSWDGNRFSSGRRSSPQQHSCRWLRSDYCSPGLR